MGSRTGTLTILPFTTFGVVYVEVQRLPCNVLYLLGGRHGGRLSDNHLVSLPLLPPAEVFPKELFRLEVMLWIFLGLYFFLKRKPVLHHRASVRGSAKEKQSLLLCKQIWIYTRWSRNVLKLFWQSQAKLQCFLTTLICWHRQGPQSDTASGVGELAGLKQEVGPES